MKNLQCNECYSFILKNSWCSIYMGYMINTYLFKIVKVIISFVAIIQTMSLHKLPKNTYHLDILIIYF
jgi:hypothetical protein